jgi:uncharacterized membrane protein
MRIAKSRDSKTFIPPNNTNGLSFASSMLLISITWLLFYMAVGSQANVGGAASAPVVASAFHPSLAPVGVLLAVLGYGVGTYMAYICGLMMQAVAP